MGKGMVSSAGSAPLLLFLLGLLVLLCFLCVHWMPFKAKLLHHQEQHHWERRGYLSWAILFVSLPDLWTSLFTFPDAFKSDDAPSAGYYWLPLPAGGQLGALFWNAPGDVSTVFACPQLPRMLLPAVPGSN
ncbi:unnamed protein product [Ilex paraguariensis]|uniref:Uncharacterized protein n=1 Tax=Ilex paraguariensis TaxID=185542 RepID=A0ABC8TQH3_9AQUA